MSEETMTLGRRITTHEASVKTAAVEVKAMTISGKQVTLSVFRQMEREPLIDEQTGLLRGVPWGRVNYHWKECGAADDLDSGYIPPHLHVVWQKGIELRRACVYQPASYDHVSRWCRWQAQQAYEWAVNEQRFYYHVRTAQQVSADAQEKAFQAALDFQKNWAFKHRDAINAYLKAETGWSRDAGKVEETRQAMEACGIPTLAEAKANLGGLEQKIETTAAHWEKSYLAICATDQLFIAV